MIIHICDICHKELHERDICSVVVSNFSFDEKGRALMEVYENAQIW